MASPQLKKTAVVAPTRRLINSGVVPTTQVRLKGIGGQVIQPKAPVPPFKKKTADPAAAAEEPAAPEPIAVPEPIAAPEPVAAPEPITAAAPEPQAAPELAAEPAPEPEPTPEPAAEPAPETETPTEAAGEEPTAEQLAQDEAYQREMEEYQRQMEEYNRQMEEYNRQMAELAAQEAAAAQAEASAAEAPAAADPAPEAAEAPAPAPAEEAAPAAEPAPAPAEEAAPAPAAEPAPAPAPAAAAPKLSVKKPGAALKKPAGIKAKAPFPAAAAAAPAPSEAGAEGEDAAAPQADPADDAGDVAAYIAQLQQPSLPIWKNKLFLSGIIGLVLMSGIAVYVYIKKEQEKAIITANNQKVMTVLRRSQAINMEKVETLADANEKGVDVKFTPEEVNFLIDIVVNPQMKDQFGRPMFGNKPEGSAQLAVLGISLACEENNDHCKVTFERLEKEAPLIKPSLYRWLLQRLATTNIKGLNSKFRKLAEALSANTDPAFRTRQELLAYIWESMVLRVTEKDVSNILKLLRQPDMDDKLTLALINCLYNIVDRIDDPAKRSELGDKIFDDLSDTMRVNAGETLGISCSPKALSFFKKRAENDKTLQGTVPYFGSYGSDDILPFLLELREKVAGDKRDSANVQAMITNLFGQRRERSEQTVKDFLAAIPAYDKVDMDTSDWDEVNEKTDPDASTFIGENNPQYPALKQRREELEACRKQKLALIRQLSGMLDYQWVVSRLEQYAHTDSDIQLAREARAALEQVKANRENDNAKRSKYRSRDKG